MPLVLKSNSTRCALGVELGRQEGGTWGSICLPMWGTRHPGSQHESNEKIMPFNGKTRQDPCVLHRKARPLMTTAILSAQEEAVQSGKKVLHGTVSEWVPRLFNAICASCQPQDTLEQAFSFTESFKATESQPLIRRWAKVLKHIAGNLPRGSSVRSEVMRSGHRCCFSSVATAASYALSFGLPQSQKSVGALGMTTRNLGAALARLFAIHEVNQRAVVMIALGVPMQTIFSLLAASWCGRRALANAPAAAWTAEPMERS